MRSGLKSYRLVIGFAPDYEVSSWEWCVRFDTMKARCEDLHRRLPNASVVLYSRLGVCLLRYDGRSHQPAGVSCRKLYV